MKTAISLNLTASGSGYKTLNQLNMILSTFQRIKQPVGILLFDSSSAGQLQRISMTAKTGRINLAGAICINPKSRKFIAHLCWLARASLFVHATAFLDHRNSFL
ncbi:hypothetical protein T4B_12918 [Trichinella pseudospiralis]|uniref:Uncharacterized protein n=2 Tax=Trichinella pseudospiralis TaxID=6337 RepID=A0A0V1FMJ5_TRIPS|nr:hypothetical protein T4D_1543 [Trichinella pseudospiralis]KRZ33432.1 hypothetical protein T4B_12918 [Trichinella pseudospiralis]KRZ41214.1 hypothetical protein T4C_9933 [Trichinella pseudospiralis]